MTPVEAVVERKFVKIVEEQGGIALKMQVPGLRGLPDRLVLMPGGVHLFIEFKRQNTFLRTQQKLVVQKLREMGHAVYVCRTVEEAWEAVEEECRKVQTKEISEASGQILDPE